MKNMFMILGDNSFMDECNGEHKNMNVAIGIDQNYISPAVVMLVSLLENNDIIVTLFILNNKLSDDDINIFVSLLKKYNSKNEVVNIKVESDWTKGAPKYSYIPVETYFNVVAPKYLPLDIDRVLYLDPDIIINKSIEGFYHQNLEGVCIVAARDQYITENDRDIRDKLKIKGYTEYINAGVILFNLEFCREKVNVDWYINQLTTTFSMMKYANQDLLNIMYDNMIRVCSSNYNYQVPRAPKNKNLLNSIENNVKIFHYTSWRKPWKLPYPGKFDYIYWKYSLMAGNKDEYQKYKKQKYVKLLIWKIKRFTEELFVMGKIVARKLVNKLSTKIIKK